MASTGQVGLKLFRVRRCLKLSIDFRATYFEAETTISNNKETFVTFKNEQLARIYFKILKLNVRRWVNIQEYTLCYSIVYTILSSKN